jgi:chromosome segregation ATPase
MSVDYTTLPDEKRERAEEIEAELDDLQDRLGELKQREADLLGELSEVVHDQLPAPEE